LQRIPYVSDFLDAATSIKKIITWEHSKSNVIGTSEMKKTAEVLARGGWVCGQWSASGADPVLHRFRAA
jgi:hypothetical protein